jgi:fructose-bisphosphate aldolase, class I
MPLPGATDESVGSITKRFQALGISSTAATRRAYRGLLFSPPRLAELISGVILYDETFRQSASDGTTFPRFLHDGGMLPGIKVDTGAKPLAGAPGEMVTEGLDGLRERIAEYLTLGARFAKWRAVIAIGDGMPSGACLTANAHGGDPSPGAGERGSSRCGISCFSLASSISATAAFPANLCR